MIVEYKMHIHPDGYTYHPPFIKAFGFYNTLDKTYLGVCLPEDQREYYIPDTLTVFTIEDAVTRCLDAGVSKEVGPGQSLTDSEMDQYVRDWIDQQYQNLGVVA